MNDIKNFTASEFYRYHDLSKHSVEKLTRSHYSLDWSNQPDPFRTWRGAELVDLPVPDYVSDQDLFRTALCISGVQGAEAGKCATGDTRFLSHLLFYSMSISAWKQVVGARNRWSLRVNPSSGDLHPTETHLLVRSISGLSPGAYHYLVPQHRLELRANADIASSLWRLLGRQTDCPPLIVCLTSIFWRESWKYRERAYRYCQHDIGHALACIAISAATLGWRTEVIGEFPDREVACLLGVDTADEKPALIIGLSPMSPSQIISNHEQESEPVIEPGTDLVSFRGTANQLSSEQIEYSVIEAVHQSTCLSLPQWHEYRSRQAKSELVRPADLSACAGLVDASYSVPDHDAGVPVHQVIRQRRSAVDMDGKRRMALAQVSSVLVTATRGFEAEFQQPTDWSKAGKTGHHLIHLYLYVHRVDGLQPGIYYFDRVEQSLMPLVLSDQREAAKFVSCFQDIAADGCFAVSMIADLGLAWRLYGNRCYRYVHYEAGWIGQWLYLTATALGLEATGIGCFIDDLINELLGLPYGMEVIYNFTVGQAVLDRRLTTLPSYPFQDPAIQD